LGQKSQENLPTPEADLFLFPPISSLDHNWDESGGVAGGVGGKL